jgi:HK97 family phage portal protein
MRAKIEPRLIPVTERRSAGYDLSWEASTGAGWVRSPFQVQSESLSAVLACVELISGAISSLPVTILQDGVPAPGAAAARILERPSARTSWPSYIQSVVASMLLFGNSVSTIQSDQRGALTGLVHVPFQWLNPMVASGPRLAFDMSTNTPETMLLGIPPRIYADDALLIRARSDNGILGRSVLSRAPAVMQLASDVSTFAGSIYSRGVNPSIVVGVPSMEADSRRRMTASWEQRYSGAGKAGSILWADSGVTVDKLTISSVDAETLASRRMSREEVCSLFNVPVVLIQPQAAAVPDLTPYITAFAMLCLTPLVTAIEHEISACLPPGQTLSLDMGGLLRGSYTAVAASQSVLKQAGLISVNDGRAALGLAPRDDGDSLGTVKPPSFPADASGMPSMAPKPGPGAGDPGALPNVGTNQDDGSNSQT